MGNSLRFGWPILVNSVLLFLVFQGDKLIVGRVLGMEALAVFAMGMTLTLTPTLVIAKSVQNFFLPQLAAVTGTAQFLGIANRVLQMVTAAALAFLVVILLLGGPVLHMLLGAKYAALIPLLIWLAIGQTLRVVKAGPAIVALALGHTSNAMIANILRILVLPLIWMVAVQTGSLLHILIVVVMGEAVSGLIAFYLLAHTSKLKMSVLLVPQLPGALAVMAVGLWATVHPPVTAMPGLGMGMLAGFVLLMAVMPIFVIRGMIGKAGKHE
jgi:O-antigen/teichoic acid export membrane protein